MTFATHPFVECCPHTNMSEHQAIIRWTRVGNGFVQGKYSREHTWTFDGGMTIPASPSPSVVPTPYSNPAHLDPEEALVAAVSSCHLLTFLHLASKQGYQVDSYQDEAVGFMTKNQDRIPWISRIELRPQIAWSGDRRPAAEDVALLHERAHEQCFIANSVKSEIVVKQVSL